MRAPSFAAPLVALAFLSPISAACADARSDIAHELIVALAARPTHDARPTVTARLAPDFFGRLGLRPLASLGDLGASSRSDRASAATPANPFAFDPARIWLVAASDSAGAAAALVSLARDPRVAWVERNAPREPALWSYAGTQDAAAAWRHPEPAPPAATGGATFPNDPLFRDGRQWGLDDVRALEAWRVTTGSNDVLLAIADTGIDPEHPELGSPMPDGTPRIHGAIDIVAGIDVRDMFGHGTPVAGVMAARTHDGAHFDSLGVAGVCGGDGDANAGCRIVPIKITRAAGGFASSFDIAAAVLHATRRGARAVNVSFTGAAPSRIERLALHEAITHGCVVVAAAGNRGFRDGLAPLYPAAYAADGLCVQVGASDPDDRRAAFSSYGPGLDLLAPGVDVWTTFMTYAAASGSPRRGYVSASGTSFAAPFVTGAIGLLAAARPELLDTDFQNLLRASARDIGAPGADRETGSGRLDLAAALALVSDAVGIWHDELAADTFEAIEQDTLTIGEPGLGGTDRTGRFAGARLVRASVTFSLPDSFVGPVRVWPRIGGTTTVRGGFVLDAVVPWAEAIAAGERRFTLCGYAYQLAEPAAPDSAVARESHLPLPLDQMRFGFTVLGRVLRPPTTDVFAAASSSARSRVSASPNPFRTVARITAPDARAIEIWDVSGRRVRRLMAGGSVGEFLWNGADDGGRATGPGVYLVRTLPARDEAPRKLLKLE